MPVLRIERIRYVVMRRNRTEIWCGLSREFHFVKVDELKDTLDVEGFRKYLSEIHKRLMRDSIPYQVAERFGIVKYVSDNVKFYFEEWRGGENESSN